MGPKTEQLTLVIEEAIGLLNQYGETHWSQWLNKDLDYILKSDFYGIEHLLTSFDGMGSFNDLYLCIENNHLITDEDKEKVNEYLNSLRNEMFALAEGIKYEVNK